jgi:hypothetical protein
MTPDAARLGQALGHDRAALSRLTTLRLQQALNEVAFRRPASTACSSAAER